MDDYFGIRNENIGPYLRDIARYKPLSSREEHDCAVRIRKGDRSALEKLVKTNLRFVVSVARTYQHQGMALADLINEGNMGMIKAAKRFDEKKNFKFISYAVWWIRQTILQALANQSRFLRIPVNRVATIQRYRKKYASLEQKYHRSPTHDEVVQELGIKRESTEGILRAIASPVYLDSSRTDDSEDTVHGSIQDTTVDRPDECLEQKAITQNLESQLSVLDDRKKEILKRYYGVGYDTKQTLEEIGAHLNLTRERVRQLKEKALQKIKKRRIKLRKNP